MPILTSMLLSVAASMEASLAVTKSVELVLMTVVAVLVCTLSMGIKEERATLKGVSQRL